MDPDIEHQLKQDEMPPNCDYILNSEQSEEYHEFVKHYSHENILNRMNEKFNSQTSPITFEINE